MIVGNEPNLNRFWLPQFNLDGDAAPRRPPTSRCWPRPTTRSRPSAPETSVWGGALAPRGVDKPNTGRDTHLADARSSATSGAAYRASGRDAAVHGRLRLPPVRRQLEQSPSTCHRRLATIGLADYDQARPAARQGVRRHGAARLGAADPLRRVRRRVRSCPRSRRRSTPARSRRRRGPSTSPRRRRVRAGAQARVLPAERRRHPPLPRPRRARPQRLAVRPLLRGRDAEVLARRRPRDDGRDHERSARQVRGRDQARRRVRAAHPYDLAPVRPRLRLSRTAGAASAPDRSRRGRTDARAPAAASRSSSAPASRQGATSSPSRSCTPRGPESSSCAPAPSFRCGARPRGADARRLRRRRQQRSGSGEDDRSSSAPSTTPSAIRGRPSSNSRRPASAPSGSRASGSRG